MRSENVFGRISRTVGAPVAGIWLAATLVGCATVPVAGAPGEAVVRQRAQARWEALIAGDFAKVYSYLSPAARETMSSDSFRSGFRAGFWKTAQVSEVKCEQDACDVKVQIAYDYRGNNVSRPVVENWIRSGDSWWFVHR